MSFKRKSLGGRWSASDSYDTNRVHPHYARGHKKFRFLKGRSTGKKSWMINR